MTQSTPVLVTLMQQYRAAVKAHDEACLKGRGFAVETLATLQKARAELDAALTARGISNPEAKP